MSSTPQQANSPSPSRITVLLSGAGTNLQALISACQTSNLPNAQIVRVISNRRAAYGLTRARDAGILTTVHALAEYKRRFAADSGPEGKHETARELYDNDLVDIVLRDGPDLVVLAGFMHVLSAGCLEKLREKGVGIINLHPSLPLAFNGANAIERAYQAFKEGKIDRTGVMVHHVVAEVDMGRPVLVREIPMIAGESLEDLEGRIHENEHEVIVQATQIALAELKEERAQKADS